MIDWAVGESSRSRLWKQKSHSGWDKSIEKPKCDEISPYLTKNVNISSVSLDHSNHSQDFHLSSISQICHPHRFCTHMNMSWLRNVVTHLNRFYPSMSHHFLNRWPVFRIGFQHLANKAATSSGIEVIDCRGTWWHGLIWVGTSSNISRI